MQRKQLAALIAVVAAILLLWSTPVVYPIKILVVFFHELSHGLASISTGGKMIQIELSHHQGGVCTTLGGNRFLILTAGYLGSMLWGGLILVAAARTRYDKYISMALGGMIVIVGIGFVRPIIGFGFLFCMLAGVVIALAGRFLNENVNDFMLKVIGLTSILYAAADIISDGLARNIADSDANVLGSITGLPGQVWSVIWLLLSIGGSYLALKIAAGGAIVEDEKKSEEN